MDDKIENTYVVMGMEPLQDIAPEQWIVLNHNCKTERDLANAFAGAWNKMWWLDDELYDENSTPEEEEQFRKWESLESELEERVLQIFIREHPHVKTEGEARIKFLTPIMRRNGYKDGHGWWIPIQGE